MECKCKFSIKKVDWEKFEKNNVTMKKRKNVLKKKKYNLLIFQNIAQIVKKQVILLMIPNEENHQAKSKE